MHLLTSPVRAACLPVDADRILAKDLAAARPEFAALDPDMDIAFAPNPGVIRVLQVAELVALAQKFGITEHAKLQSVCFVHPAKITATPKPAPVTMDVQRGERVAVEVLSGSALLRFLADAETSGHVGDSVLIRNPETGKLFQAKVEAKGKVMVQR